MNGVMISRHALERACDRWGQPNFVQARTAIRDVIAYGSARYNVRVTVYQHGPRCVRVVDGWAVTVTLNDSYGPLESLLRSLRRVVRKSRKKRH